MSTAPPLPLTKADFQSDQETRWCPGCGDYSVLAAIQGFMPELGIAPEKIVFVTGIDGAPFRYRVTHLRDQLPLYEAFGYRRQPFTPAELEPPVTTESIPIVRAGRAGRAVAASGHRVVACGTCLRVAAALENHLGELPQGAQEWLKSHIDQWRQSGGFSQW